MTPPDRRRMARRAVAVVVGLGGAASLATAVVLFLLQRPQGIAAGVGAALVPGTVGILAGVAARRWWRRAAEGG